MLRTTHSARTASTALFAALVLSLAAVGCGGDDDSGKKSLGDGTSKPSDGGGGDGGDAGGTVSNLDDVQSATIQIEAQGTFVAPEGSLAQAAEFVQAGSGSGFIIDESGLAVTNNHVVTGAATLEVFVGGDDKAKTAKVVGVSECSDLAVIDIEGDGYPTLGWYDGDVKPGLEVYAAGFPLGDPDFTLTNGIVSKLKDEQPFNIAEVRGVIEHDAAIQPGNSGGPLVTKDGEVVGVNYAGLAIATTTEQFWAISGDTAQSVVEQLREGTDVESLGVNGQAVFDEAAGVVGIWVASVDTDSPAGEAGIQGGDIIERVEGLPMGTDGSMTDYCKVLRSHDASDVMSVQVLRFADETRLRGEFNGDELAAVESFGAQVEEEVGDVEDTGTTYDFELFTDDTGTIEVEVPTAWSDRASGAGFYVVDNPDDTYGIGVVASPDAAAFDETWDVPGMRFGATIEDIAFEDLLEVSSHADQCTSLGQEAYDDGLYQGLWEIQKDCGGTSTQWVMIAAEPAGGEYTVFVGVQVVSDADLDALDRIIQTFKVIGEPPS